MIWLEVASVALAMVLAWDSGRWLFVHWYSGTDLSVGQLWALGIRCAVLLVAVLAVVVTAFVLRRR